MCWDTTSYGSKDGRSDAPATSPRSSRPHRHTAVLSMDGSERYAFRCRRLQREVHRNSFMQTGLTMGKGADIFALVSRGHRSDRIPPRESPRRAHGTLQPVWMKVL